MNEVKGATDEGSHMGQILQGRVDSQQRELLEVTPPALTLKPQR